MPSKISQLSSSFRWHLCSCWQVSPACLMSCPFVWVGSSIGHGLSKPQSGHTSTLQEETTGLWKRIRLVNWSLRLFVCAALLVCMVIVTLFLAELARMNLSDAIAAQFICAMTLMIGGLLLFLFEVSVSTNRIRRGIVEILDTDK